MPTLSSLGAASAFGWHQNTPVVSGGALTADSTYYYRTFVNTGADTLTITGGQLELDYLIVGAGGAGGYSGITGTNNWNYNYHSFGTCQSWDGSYNCVPSYASAYGSYWTSCYDPDWGYFLCWPLNIEYGWNYYPDYSETRWIFYGGGGGGGVASGKIKLNPGSHSIQVGEPKPAGTNGFFTAMASKAFGIWAHGGGSGEPGAGNAWAGGASLSGAIYEGGYANRFNYVDQFMLDIAQNYINSDMINLRDADNSTEVSGTSIGRAGGGDHSYDTPNRTNMPLPYHQTIYNKINYNWYVLSAIDIVGFGGWGGGAGKGGQSQGKYACERMDGSGNPMWNVTASTDMSSANYKPDVEAGLTATFVEQGVGSRSFINPADSQVVNTTTKFGVWDNVEWGKGVEMMGLKVGGGGMTHGNARTLANSYGGGYPGNATINGHVYSTNGAPNTGGGGGTGLGGSGVVRVRYLRSAVGG